MHSPSTKNDKLLTSDVDQLETAAGADGIPEHIWADIRKNERFLYFAFMFLNASVLWAYYSGLSAQDFYKVQFKQSQYDFEFLTTLVFAWPMVGGFAIQVLFGIDKRVSVQTRMYAGYFVFTLLGVLIMAFSAIKFSDNIYPDDYELKPGDKSDPGQDKGAILVLLCFGLIGFANSLTEATNYTIAALFPVPKFANAVQIGNGCAGIFNITVATILRLLVGGVKQKKESTKLSFYLFFSFLIIVMVAAVLTFRRVMNLPCIRFLIERNDAATKEKDLALNPRQTLINLFRIFRVIWAPAITTFLIFFVSLGVFPGFGCAAGRNLDPKLGYATHPYEITPKWYCAPGIIGSYNYGDFLGRVLCGAAVTKLLTMKISFVLTILRIGYIPIMLAGVAGSSFYFFGSHIESSLVWNICWNLTIGITNGLLSTVMMGIGPLMVAPEDRETAGAVMVFFLFLGIASGAHFGFLVSSKGWLGL